VKEFNRQHLTQVLKLLKDGYTTDIIAKHLDIDEQAVKKVIILHRLQRREAAFVQSLNDQIQNRLPILLNYALDELERIITSPSSSEKDKLHAIKLTAQFIGGRNQ